MKRQHLGYALLVLAVLVAIGSLVTALAETAHRAVDIGLPASDRLGWGDLLTALLALGLFALYSIVSVLTWRRSR